MALPVFGSLVHNPWGEVNPDLEIVAEGFDAARVRRDNLVAYLLPRLGRAKVFVVAEAVGYQGAALQVLLLLVKECY